MIGDLYSTQWGTYVTIHNCELLTRYTISKMKMNSFFKSLNATQTCGLWHDATWIKASSDKNAETIYSESIVREKKKLDGRVRSLMKKCFFQKQWWFFFFFFFSFLLNLPWCNEYHGIKWGLNRNSTTLFAGANGKNIHIKGSFTRHGNGEHGIQRRRWPMGVEPNNKSCWRCVNVPMVNNATVVQAPAPLLSRVKDPKMSNPPRSHRNR